MSTIVYQEILHTNHHEASQIGEPKTLSLRLTNKSSNTYSLAPPATSSSGWGAIESLSISNDKREREQQQPEYIHPLSKRWSSNALSQKSLEMCTESLGCETGSFMTLDSSAFLFPTTNTKRKPEPRKTSSECDKPTIRSTADKFPPPLTTISGSNSISVRPYRENGRLVIEAVSAPPKHSYLQAERSDGRLKLSFVEESECSYECEDEEDEEERETFDDEQDVENESIKEDMNGIKLNFEVKMGISREQLIQSQRLRSRCKEGGRGNNASNKRSLINWESFWVAT